MQSMSLRGKGFGIKVVALPTKLILKYLLRTPVVLLKALNRKI